MEGGKTNEEGKTKMDKNRGKKQEKKAGKQEVTKSGDERMNEVKDQLNCCICLERMKVPTSAIPCLHTFCELCILTCLKRDNKCPTCRQ